MEVNLPSSSRRQRTILALVVAHAIAGVALAAVGPGPTVWTQVYLASVVSQSSLVGMWLGIGQTPFVRRAALSVLALFGIVGALGATMLWLGDFFDYSAVSLIARLVTIDSVAVALTAVIMRRTGWLLEIPASPPSVTVRPHIQFTLLDMLLFTTVVALVLVAFSLARRNVSDVGLFDLLGLLAIASTSITLCVTWSALSRQSYVWRLLALPVAILTGLSAYYLQNEWYLPIVLAIHGAISTVTLFVVRSAGYRLFVGERPSAA
jgi:hypothetical protein